MGDASWLDSDKKWYVDDCDVWHDKGYWIDDVYQSFLWHDANAAGDFGNKWAAATSYEIGTTTAGPDEKEDVWLHLNICDNYGHMYDDPNTTASVPHSAMIEVFDSHLSRDVLNVFQFNQNIGSCSCAQAAAHAHHGDNDHTNPTRPPWPYQEGDEELLYDVDQDPDIPAENGNPWTAEDTAKLNRGDCLALDGLRITHIVTVTEGTDLWEFNGLSGANFGTKTVGNYTDALTTTTEDGEVIDIRLVATIKHW